MIPCAQTGIQQRIQIQQLFFLDHVVIYAILCVLMDGHVSHLHHFFSSCGFSSFLPFFLVDGNACVVQPALDQQNYEG